MMYMCDETLMLRVSKNLHFYCVREAISKIKMICFFLWSKIVCNFCSQLQQQQKSQKVDGFQFRSFYTAVTPR